MAMKPASLSVNSIPIPHRLQQQAGPAAVLLIKHRHKYIDIGTKPKALYCLTGRLDHIESLSRSFFIRNGTANGNPIISTSTADTEAFGVRDNETIVIGCGLEQQEYEQY